MKVGFIGLGSMGSAIAANLLKGGHELWVWNRSPQAPQRLADAGAHIAASAEQAFEAEVVFSMLADDAAVRAVLLDSGVLERSGKPRAHINMATVSPAFAEELAERHRACEVDYVAAPVMGRPDVAAAAKLNILAAGPASVIARVQPLFDLIGQKTWPCGEQPARANVLKLAINLMLAAAVESLGEAAALVDAHGIAPAALIEIISNSLFPGPVYGGYGGLIAAQRYEPAAFKAVLALKDVRLALAAGEQARVPLPMGSVVRDSLIDAMAHGDGDKDLAVLGLVSARRAGQAV
jgi:3-hydroxyisobutyrate dehydrogenase-like beta-hydroxyacid dehydrogenase